METEHIIKLENVNKKFNSKGMDVLAVKEINLEIRRGEIFGIIGFSGAGKSTLVRCFNLLERPTEGAVYFDGENLMEANPAELRKIRQQMGMIFQQFNLLEQRNVIDNICYPLEIAGVKKAERIERAKELLKLVDLSDKEKAYPAQLSGGQKQRVAIARALATNPEVILCDEATSALDPITTKSILGLLKKINQTRGVTIIVITHEMKVAEQICDRIAVMSQEMIGLLGKGILETLYMVLVSSALSYVIGIPLGVLVFVTDRNGICQNKVVNFVVGGIINLVRSIPFLILLVAILPFTRLVVETAIGSTATIVPLVIAAAPYVARMVESSLKEVDGGVIEAAQAMGSSAFQIIYKVLLPEAKPSLVVGATISLATILGYSAMAGFVGGGGLGAIATNYGYYRYDSQTMLITVVLLVAIVQFFQESGLRLVHRIDKRIK